MEKWKLDSTSLVIGSLITYLVIFLNLSKSEKSDERNLAGIARITVVVDSAKTTDWNNPVTDTIITMPVGASGWVKGRVSSLFEKGAIKVETSQVSAKKETTPKPELSR